MKKFFEEFKKFITRGNVVDMAVGVIVGSSFTAVVNGMSNYILKPIINWLLALIFGANSLSDVFTMLKTSYDVDGNIDLANSIYINWGEFINTIINFLIVAFVLFSIVKIINSFRDLQKSVDERINSTKLTKEEKAELRATGANVRDKKAIKAFLENKAIEQAKQKAEKEAKEKELLLRERELNPTTEDLLKQILAEMKNK